jgi:hypothetical protein
MAGVFLDLGLAEKSRKMFSEGAKQADQYVVVREAVKKFRREYVER